LRDLERVERYKDTSGDWTRFAKKLRRLIRDAIRLRQRRDEMTPATYERRYQRIQQRLQMMIEKQWTNREARRLVKRLRRHQQELFTFVRDPKVPFENNFAERVSLKTLAQMLDAHRSSIRRWLQQAGIRPIVLGKGRNGAIRYKWQDVQEWIESRERTA